MIPEYRTNKILAQSVSTPLKVLLENYFNKEKAETLATQFTFLAEATFYGVDFESTINKAIQGDLQQTKIDAICEHLVIVLKESIGSRHPDKIGKIKETFRASFNNTIEAIIGMEQCAHLNTEQTNLQDLSFLLN